jgi:hypothetical protein
VGEIFLGSKIAPGNVELVDLNVSSPRAGA